MAETGEKMAARERIVALDELSLEIVKLVAHLPISEALMATLGAAREILTRILELDPPKFAAHPFVALLTMIEANLEAAVNAMKCVPPAN